LIHVNVTDHPTAGWTARQIVEAFPDESAPQFLLRDRDAIYGEEFARRVTGMGTREVRIAPRAPWQNPFVERVIGSLRRECLRGRNSWARSRGARCVSRSRSEARGHHPPPRGEPADLPRRPRPA